MTRRSTDDRDLERAFARLRAHDEAHRPDAADVLARARAEADRLRATASDESPADEFTAARRRRRLGWGLPGLGAALAAAAAGLLLLDSGPGTDGDADFERVVEAWTTTGGAWRSPTDPLLRTPGDRILRTVPRLEGLRLPAPNLDSPPPEGLESLS